MRLFKHCQRIQRMVMEKEFQFYLHADLHQYDGTYIAIVGDRVVASGNDSEKVLEEARKKTGKTALLVKVPAEDTLVFAQ